MRILVSGAAGFVGSHLCRALLDRGDDVIGIDNLLTGRMKNVEDLVERENFRFVKHDVSEFTHVPGDVDAVLHFASPASPRDFSEIPIKIMKVNSLGTHRLLGLALEKGAKFLLASTSEVYGDPLVHPQPETYWGNVNPNGARSMYDESKRFAEALVKAYEMQHNVDIRIVRIFNTYGPAMRVDDGRVVTNFVAQALRGDPITIYGDGEQTRSFTYVSDLVRGVLLLLDSDYRSPVNIGNPREFKVRELAEMVLEMTGSTSEIVAKPLPPDDPTQRCPDISLATAKLGWSPEVDLVAGLRLTIDYLKNELAGTTND